MSDIQSIIELIEKGSSNSDHRDGQRQINEAVSMLRRVQEDSHLHSGQRWELSQILECGPLYGDIEKAVRGMKEAQTERWLPIGSAPKDGTKVLLRGGMQADTGLGDEQEAAKGIAVCWWHDGFWRFACYDGGYLGIWEGATEWKPLSVLNDKGGWQPIETADMDCFGEILAYEAGNGHIYRTSYCREDGAWLISSTHEIWHPTYWIPLPLPPSLAETE